MTTEKYLISFFLLLLGCIQPQTDKENLQQEQFPINDTNFTTQITVVDTTEIIESGDTLIIKGTCAVLYIPDSLKIQKLKKEYGEEKFYVTADDNLWYVAQSREFLINQRIKVVDTDKKKIVFIKNNGQRTIMNIDSLEFDFGLLLFDGTREPKEASIVDVEDDYKKYF